MRGAIFAVKLGLVPGFSGGSEYSVTPGYPQNLDLAAVPSHLDLDGLPSHLDLAEVARCGQTHGWTDTFQNITLARTTYAVGKDVQCFFSWFPRWEKSGVQGIKNDKSF